MRRALLASAAILTAACATALPESDLAALLPLGPRTAQRLTLEVEIDSPRLSGTFDGVLVARPDPPAVRLQLLPDLGAPILDVSATPERVAGVMHGDAEPRVWAAADDGDRAPELLLLFGITLLEQHAQVTRGRVLAAVAGTPVRLRLRGAFPGTTVDDAEVAGGAVRGRSYRFGMARWRDRIEGDAGTVEGAGFALRARVVAREDAGTLDDALFEQCPGGRSVRSAPNRSTSRAGQSSPHAVHPLRSPPGTRRSGRRNRRTGRAAAARPSE